jgi:AcrR family transcriptional regulator
MKTTNPHRPPGRPKDPERTRRRKDEILAASAIVFARRGYDATDLEEIAKELGVSKAALYYYYPSKESLFFAAVDHGMHLLRDAVHSVSRQQPDPLHRLGEAIRAYLRFFHDHPQFVELMIQERAVFRDRKKSTYFEYRDANVHEWRDLIAGLIKAGRLLNVPVDGILDVLGAQVYGTMFAAHFSGARKSPERQAADIIDIVIGGLLTPAERRKQSGR